MTNISESAPTGGRRFMQQRTGRLLLGLLILLGVVDTLLGVRFPVMSALERSAYDQRLKLTAPRVYEGEITLIMVDDAALEAVGRWPWPRETLASLVREIFEAHSPRLLVFDMVFSEAAEKPSGDLAFAESLRLGQTVIGYVIRGAAGTGALVAEDFLFNQPAFEAAASATGFLNSTVDPDGRLRRVPMLAMWSRETLPSLSLAAYGTLTGTGSPSAPASLRSGALTGSALTLAQDQKWPLDGEMRAMVPFYARAGVFPAISAAKLLGGQLPHGALNDRIVIVGADATGLRDSYPTPVSPMQAGVEVHATLLDAMLTGRALRDSPTTRLLAGIWLMVMATTCLWCRARALRAQVWVAPMALLLTVGLNVVLFAAPGWVLPLTPSVVVLGVFSLAPFVGWTASRQPADRPRRGTSSGAAADSVDLESLDGRQRWRASRASEPDVNGPQRVDMMVTLLELERFVGSLPPEALARLFEAQHAYIEACLVGTSARVTDLGDGRIMTVWTGANAGNTAMMAAAAAARLTGGIRDLNQQLSSEKLPPVRLLVLGQAEPSESASVWFAQARRLAPAFGVLMLMNEAFKNACDGMVWRDVDLVRMRPGTAPVRMFGLVPVADDDRCDWPAECAALDRALAAYRAGSLREARAAFEALSRHSREPRLYQRYLERIDAVHGHAPSGWDGVTDLTGDVVS